MLQPQGRRTGRRRAPWRRDRRDPHSLPQRLPRLLGERGA